MTTLHLKKSISRSPLRCGFLFISLAVALAWLAVLSVAQAQLPSPSPTPPGLQSQRSTSQGGALSGAGLGCQPGADAVHQHVNYFAGAPDCGVPTVTVQTLTNPFDHACSVFISFTVDDDILINGQVYQSPGTNFIFHDTAPDPCPDANGQHSDQYCAVMNPGEQITLGVRNNFRGQISLDADVYFSPPSALQNTALGDLALIENTTGSFNTAIGSRALAFNTTGDGNTANGAGALFSNTIGIQNTASGVSALASNTMGQSNTASGFHALVSNTTGGGNTANGVQALASNTTGIRDTANGANALSNNTTGSNNIALGFSAGANLTIGSNNIDVGNPGVAGETGVIRIGKPATATATFIAGISGKTAANGVGVVVNSNGQLGTILSSARFKTDIKPMDKASEAILALKPVTFHYKQELDPDGISQFGLIAEEVEKVNPDLVVRGEDGKVNTVRYEAVNAMLLNEFLKEHRKVEEQHATITQQRKDFEAKFAEQRRQIEALSAGLQKVSAAVELNKSAPTQVADSR